MNKQENKSQVSIDVNLLTYTSKDNTQFALTEDDYLKTIKQAISNLETNFITNSEKEISDKDMVYEFTSFKIHSPITELKYKESNKKTYPHFVHHFLKEYYVERYNNSFNPKKGLHVEMINDSSVYSVKDLIITHLISGCGVRMVGNPENNKRVKDFKDTKELKEFFKFILDTKMFNINDKFVLPEKLKEENNNWWFLESMGKRYSNSTIGELLILECWRNDFNLEVVKWLVDNYKLKLKDIFIVIFDIVDRRAHEANNMGVLYKDKDGWAKNSYKASIKFINYLRKKFGEKFTTKLGNSYGKIINYKNAHDFIFDLLSDLQYEHYKTEEELNRRMKAEKKAVNEYLLNFKEKKNSHLK